MDNWDKSMAHLSDSAAEVEKPDELTPRLARSGGRLAD